MQSLASDVNSPDFVGATHPDSALHVDFYMHKPLDKWSSEVKSAEAQRIVRVYGEEQPFIRIMKPGDQTSIIETPVREEHKMRFPEHWMRFQMAEGLIDQQKIPGWQIEDWPYLLDKQEILRELKYGRYSTVEQVAGASDAQVQKMGLGGIGIREQARADLRKKLSSELHEAVKEKDEELARLKQSDAEKETRLAELEKKLHALLEEEPKRGPGRPRKEVVDG